MDINSFDFSGSSRLFLRHPTSQEELTDEGEPVYIDLFGKDSEEYRKSIARIGNRVSKSGRMTVEQQKQDTIELLADSTAGWSGFYDGEDALECSKANAKVLYKQQWVREQVDAFVHDRANFLLTA